LKHRLADRGVIRVAFPQSAGFFLGQKSVTDVIGEVSAGTLQLMM
jgi:hypothetical protein